MYGFTVTPVRAGSLSPRAGKIATRGSVSNSARTTASPAIPIFFRSQRTRSDGMRLDRPRGCTMVVVTPPIAETRRPTLSSHEVHVFHSASWSLFSHISTAISIPIASSLPTFIERA